MASLREKAAAAGFGSNRPSWESVGLGRADSDPDSIIRGLNLSGFMGTGSDWIADVVNLLNRAVKSPYLNGLYGEPVAYRSRNGIAISAAEDVYSFGRGAVMLRMIKSTLWAAELTGRIALPTRVRVTATSDGRGVWIYV